jgi:hypothetical protein
MFLGHISNFFKTVKPYLQETAQNFEKNVSQKGLGIAFDKPVKPYHFQKKTS